MNPGERAVRRKLGEKFRDGDRLELLVAAQPAIERMQKGVAVPLIKVPAILAVEGDHGEPGAVLLPPPDVMQPINQVGCRLFGAPVLVLEPDGVRQPAVAEEHMDRGAVGLRPVGDVEQLRLHHPAVAVAVEGTAE